MEKEKFEIFIERYLKNFRKYYKDCTNAFQRRELKKSVFNNVNLSGEQKKLFWEKVISNER